MTSTSSIPIKNIFQMLCYAWEYFPASNTSERSGIEEVDTVQDLLSKCFMFALYDLCKKGLRKGYVEERTEGPYIKGKLKVVPSVQKGLLAQGRACCEHDTYDRNILLNQIIKTTTQALASLPLRSKDTKELLQSEIKKLSDIATLTRIDRHIFQNIHLDRHHQDYRVILAICELIWAQLAPDRSGSGIKFASFLNDEVLMRRIFETFVRNFFAFECKSKFTKVKSETMRWWPDDNSANTGLLPVLRTDTSLINSERYIVIETKYTPRIMARSNHAAAGQEKLRSQHLYQLLSYLENIRQTRGRTPEGILLYPLAQRDIQATYRIWSFTVHVRCLNLNQDWQGVRQDLLELIGVPRDIVAA